MVYLIVALSLTLIHGLFVAAEYAFAKTANRGYNPATTPISNESTANILLHIQSYLQVCQIARTMAILGIGVCFGLGLSRVINEANTTSSAVDLISYCVGILVFLLIHTVVGFELPKMLGIIRSDWCVSVLSGFLRVSKLVLFPISWAVNRLSRFSTTKRM